MITLSFAADNQEELNGKLLAYVAGLTSGALIDATKFGAPDDKETKKEVANTDEKVKDDVQTTSTEAKTTGRTSGRRNTKKEETTEEDGSKGRRSRTTEKKSLVEDSEEQAALRAQLVTDLQDLADVEEAHGEVADALKRVGAKTVKEIASDSLGDFNEDIQELIGKYFE